MIKNVKHLKLNITVAPVFLSIQILKTIKYKCLCCNKSYQRKFDKKLKERFFNTQNLSNHDNNKFILLSGKGVYSWEYMDDWEKLNETPLPEKDFYCHLNMEDITDGDRLRTCKKSL